MTKNNIHLMANTDGNLPPIMYFTKFAAFMLKHLYTFFPIQKWCWSLLFLLTLVINGIAQEKNQALAHLNNLFDNHFFEHLEAEYLLIKMKDINAQREAWQQPTQLSLAEQKKITYYKIGLLQQNQANAIDDLQKIAYAQSEFYFSEISSYYLANYYFEHEQFSTALSFINMTTPFATNNEEWRWVMMKKAYCYFQEKQYVLAYKLFKSLAENKKNTYANYATFYVGYVAYLLGDYNQSIQSLKLVHQLAPFNKIAPLVIVQSFLKKNQFDSIIDYEKQQVYTPSPTDTIHFVAWNKLLAYSFFIKQNYPQAISYFQKINIDKSTQENDLNFLYAYAYALYQQKEFVLAKPLLVHIFTHANTENTLHNETAFLLASLYLADNDKAKARSLFATISKDINNRDKKQMATFLYAKLSLDLGYINEAIHTLNELAQDTTHPQREEIIDNLAQSLALAHDFKMAYTILSKIANPSENLKKIIPIIYFKYAQLLVQQQEHNEAYVLLSAVEKNAATSKKLLEDIYFWKIEINLIKNNLHEANEYAEIFEENIPPNKSSEKIRKFAYNYGYLLMKEGIYKEALHYFSRIAVSPKKRELLDWELDAFVYQADCHLMLKNYAKAQHDYNEIISYGKQYADYAYFQNCQIVGFKSLVEKETMLDKFETLFPSSPYLFKAHTEKIAILVNSKRYAPAIAMLEKMLSETKEHVSIEETDLMLQLALCYYNTKNINKASSLYQNIIVQHTTSEAAKEAMRNLREISVENNRVDELQTFLQVAGITIDDNELDSLDFMVVNNHILNKSNEKTIFQSTTQYLSRHPNGRYAARANFILAKQTSAQGSWDQAMMYYKNVLSLPKNEFSESASLALAKIAYFELKDYTTAKEYFEQIIASSQNASYIEDALRGLLRIYYFEKNWSFGWRIAQKIIHYPSYSADDKDLVALISGKFKQMEKDNIGAIHDFSQIKQQSYYYPETQYEIARCFVRMDSLQKAKKIALAITKLNTPNTFFYSKSYLLLGEIFIKEKDYFNAKATLQSLAQYAKDSTIRQEAKLKLDEINVLSEL